MFGHGCNCMFLKTFNLVLAGRYRCSSERVLSTMLLGLPWELGLAESHTLYDHVSWVQKPVATDRQAGSFCD